MITRLFVFLLPILPFSTVVWILPAAADFTPLTIAESTLVVQTTPTAGATPPAELCPEPALSRLLSHRIAPGETLESIAQRYNLIPATLMGFNPALRSGSVPVGTEIQIPPYNGIRAEVPAGSTWQQLASTYDIRADALFEVNGCPGQVPTVVFVPGVNWSPTATASQPNPSSPTPTPSNPLSRSPLPGSTTLLSKYGWQLNPASGEVVFQSGVNLGAAAGTPVLAAGAGTVAFAGEQEGYGNLVVINHSQGLQTRYAQLGQIEVQVGQVVSSGDRLATVGATATTPSLLFEVRSNSELGWVAQDPGNYIEALRSNNLQ